MPIPLRPARRPGLPALVYRPLATGTQTAAAALLQATSLSYLVVAGQIGVQLDLIRAATYAALVRGRPIPCCSSS